MSDASTFKEGDLVAVAGGEIGKDKSVANTGSIATVVAVGLHDLMVCPDELHKILYRVPKDICSSVKISPKQLVKSKIAEPSLGDLVLSYSYKVYSQDPPRKVSGVLYKITYKMGEPDMCTIMSGTDFESVPFSSVLLVQKGK